MGTAGGIDDFNLVLLAFIADMIRTKESTRIYCFGRKDTFNNERSIERPPNVAFNKEAE